MKYTLLFLSLLLPQLLLSEPHIPEALKPWQEWVKQRTPLRDCAEVKGSPQCVWPGKLRIETSQQSGSFTYDLTLDHLSEAPLPGDSSLGVHSVAIQRKGVSVKAPLYLKNNTPHVKLAPGSYTITGEYTWNRPPRSITIPQSIGQLTLVVNDKQVDTPHLTDDSKLWLGVLQPKVKQQSDSISINLFRKLKDGVPFHVTTAISLRISGNPREIALGNLFPLQSTPIRVLSPLPYRLDEKRNLFVQGKPGTFELRLQSLYATPPTELSPTSNSNQLKEWPEDEVWVFEPNELLRTVEIKGGLPVDPSRTKLPKDWRNLRAFILSSSDSLSLEEVRRGEQTSPSNQLHLNRQMWLDLEGNGFTVRDNITGTMNKDWRLNSSKRLALGRVSVDRTDQLITTDPQSSLSGVELRTQQLQITSDSRIEGSSSNLPAVGWEHDVSSLATTLHTPPGWSLLTVTGVDDASGTWASTWTLLDVFLVILIAVAASKLFGVSSGLLVGAGLILSHKLTFAPFHVWFHLMGSYALMKYLPSGTAKKFAKWYYTLTLALVGFVVVAFAGEQVRMGLFPQTKTLTGFYGNLLEGLLWLAEYSALTWLTVCVLIIIGWKFLTTLLRFEFWNSIKIFFVLCAATFAAIFINASTSSIGRQANIASYQQAELTRQYSKTRSQSLDALSASEDMAFGSSVPKNLKEKVFQRDPKAIIQTGPGLPKWNWKSFRFSWSGPVAASDTYSLYLIGPTVNLLLSLLRAALFALFCLIVLSRARKELTLTLLCFFLPLLPSKAIASPFPESVLLQELSEVIDKDRCTANCASIEELHMKVLGSSAHIKLVVSARADSAIPLPGPVTQFTPKQIMLAGKPHNKTRRDKNNILWTRVSKGKHTFDILGSLGKENVINLQFLQAPLFTQIEAPGWDVDGVTPWHTLSGSVQLSRKATALGSADDSTRQEDQGTQLPEFYRVNRKLVLGLPWTVETRVTRLGTSDRPVITRIPLLDGESVQSSQVKVDNGAALVSFSRGESSVAWSGELKEQASFTLTASAQTSFTESWELACSPIWRCQPSGLAPFRSLNYGSQHYEWEPYPGESVAISVMRPNATEGEAITIDSVTYDLKPGSRIVHGTLNLAVRASQGGTKVVELPAKASLQKVQIGAVDHTSRYEGTQLSLPLSPGSSNVHIEFSLTDPPGFRYQAPPLSIDGKYYNVHQTISVPKTKWLLLTSGPDWGPAVLFWAKLIVLLVGSILLSRLPSSPLSAKEWILLGLGLACLPLVIAAVPATWLLLLELKRRRQFEDAHTYNLSQIGLTLLTFASLAILYQAIKIGLLLQPNMLVRGNNSSSSLLSWYTDSAAETLPSTTAYWLPSWTWNVVMILWSTWLVFALIRWLKGGFQALLEGGLWKRQENQSTTD